MVRIRKDEMAQALVREWNAVDNFTGLFRDWFTVAVGVHSGDSSNEGNTRYGFDNNEEFSP